MDPCYICWRPTLQKSPCLCAAACHAKCMHKWITYKNDADFTKRKCTICKGMLWDTWVLTYVIVTTGTKYVRAAWFYTLVIWNIFVDAHHTGVQRPLRVLSGILLLLNVVFTVLHILLRKRFNIINLG